MIKSISDISEKCIDYINRHGAVVAEKLDLPYFTVSVDRNLTLINSKGREINDMDCIVNTIYKDMWDFVDNNFDTFTLLYRTFGKCRIGFFYMPVHKTNIIEYNNINDGSFILGSFYCADKSKKDETKLENIFDGIAMPFPNICRIENISDIDMTASPVDVISAIIGDNKTCSGNLISEIEGIVVTSGKYKFQVLVNPAIPNIDKESKKIYRDKLLCNFANVIYDRIKENNVRLTDDYITNICNVFLEYINVTDIFNTTYIEPEDLLPPKIGYFGDIDFDRLPSTVRIVCANELYKNVLRILLVTFAYDIDKKIGGFPSDEREKLNFISTQINNMNNRI